MAFERNYFLAVGVAALLCIFEEVPAQDSLVYKLSVKADSIGHLLVVRNVNSDSSFAISVKSRAGYRFLFSVNVSFDYYSRFNRNGSLDSSYFRYTFNDKIKEENYMVRRDTAYEFYMEGKLIRHIGTLYYQTALTMYFTEPKTNEPIISERFLTEMELDLLGPSHYSVVFPTGENNHYYYDLLSCKRIWIDMNLVDMDINLVYRYLQPEKKKASG